METVYPGASKAAELPSPGNQGDPKVGRARRGKSVPRAKVELSPLGRAAKERLFPIHPLVQFAGVQRAAGPLEPSLTVREGLGGLRLRMYVRKNAWQTFQNKVQLLYKRN